MSKDKAIQSDMPIRDRAYEVFKIDMENQVMYGNSSLLMDKARNYVLYNIGSATKCFVYIEKL